MVTPSVDSLLKIVRIFQSHDVPYMVVGAFAVMAHGMPRSSADIDFVVHLPYSERGTVMDILRAAGYTDFEERRDEFGQRVVFEAEPLLDVEVFFTPRNVVYDREYDRRVHRSIGGQDVPFLSPEDLVLRKLVNMRLRRGLDYDDVVGVIAVQGDALDLDYVRQHAEFYRVSDALERAVLDAREAAGEAPPEA